MRVPITKTKEWVKRQIFGDPIHFSFIIHHNPFIYTLAARSKRGADLWGLSSSAIQSNLRFNDCLTFPLFPLSMDWSFACRISSQCLHLIRLAPSPAFNTPPLAITFLVSSCHFARSWVSFLCSRRVSSASTPAIIMPKLASINQLSRRWEIEEASSIREV